MCCLGVYATLRKVTGWDDASDELPVHLPEDDSYRQVVLRETGKVGLGVRECVGLGEEGLSSVVMLTSLLFVHERRR